MIERLPALIAAFCLTIYWAYVPYKGYRHRRKTGQSFNPIPKEPVGKIMRLLWYPCVGTLVVGLWTTVILIPKPIDDAHLFTGWFYEPGAGWTWGIVAPATLACLMCTGFTFICWREMGRSWRIGINPNEKLDIVSTGPYKFVRHPIYSLRMAINICAVIMAPTLFVAIPAAIDFFLLQIEARREEKYMESVHGESYAKYKNSVGRFVPRALIG